MNPEVAPTSCIVLIRKRLEYTESLTVLNINTKETTSNATAMHTSVRDTLCRVWLTLSISSLCTFTSLTCGIRFIGATSICILSAQAYSLVTFTSSSGVKGFTPARLIMFSSSPTIFCQRSRISSGDEYTVELTELHFFSPSVILEMSSAVTPSLKIITNPILSLTD